MGVVLVFALGAFRRLCGSLTCVEFRVLFYLSRAGQTLGLSTGDENGYA